MYIWKCFRFEQMFPFYCKETLKILFWNFYQTSCMALQGKRYS